MRIPVFHSGKYSRFLTFLYMCFPAGALLFFPKYFGIVCMGCSIGRTEFLAEGLTRSSFSKEMFGTIKVISKLIETHPNVIYFASRARARGPQT